MNTYWSCSTIVKKLLLLNFCPNFSRVFTRPMSAKHFLCMTISKKYPTILPPGHSVTVCPGGDIIYPSPRREQNIRCLSIHSFFDSGLKMIKICSDSDSKLAKQRATAEQRLWMLSQTTVPIHYFLDWSNPTRPVCPPMLSTQTSSCPSCSMFSSFPTVTKVKRQLWKIQKTQPVAI